MTIRQTLGHYQILAPIGSGGMGEVYAAKDPVLGRKVAIKLLPERLAGERDNLSRFTQEARSASALNHPNIVTIHEVGTDEADGTPYIVMEFIEGRDLRSAIHAGIPPIRKILDVAVQIADGLAVAHERGIIHRDLKPENIMITRDGYVKLLDFGLAKIVSTSSDTEHTLMLDMPGTNPGTILGTVGYMSPEQARGKRIDFRSDQFALGAILYELTTGQPAFQGESAIDTLSQILHVHPEAIPKRNPHVPPQFTEIVQRLLSKEADERYASTRDLARELKSLRDRVIAEESGFHAPAGEKRSMPWVAIAAAATLALILGVGAWMSRERGAPAAPPAQSAPATGKKYLAVVGFNDLTGDPNGQLVVDGFAETLTARLAGYPSLQVMRPAASDAPRRDPKQAARELGANLVLTGSMMRSGDRIRVTWSVVDPASGRELRDLVEGSMSDLFGVQDRVADSVAAQLALGPAPKREPLDPAISQRRYLEALGHLRRYDSEASIDSAIRILEELGASPSVQAALARAYLLKFQETRQPQYAASAGAAAERALQNDPQSVNVNVTVGELRRLTGRYDESVAAFLRVLSQQPNHADAVLGLAETYQAAGDVKNAEASYKRAIALQPQYWAGYNKLGVFYFTQARISDAVPMFRKVTELVPDNERGYVNLGAAYQQLGRYEDAVRVFSQSIARVPSAHGYSNLGTCHYFLGRNAEAAAAFEKATLLTPNDYSYWRNLGDAYRWVPGQQAKAAAAYDRTIRLARETIAVSPGEGFAHLCLAVALAKRGREEEARGALLRALELEPRNPFFVYEAAVIANLTGSEAETVARLQQALRLGYNPADAERDPEFANLRKTGRLRDVIRSEK